MGWFLQSYPPPHHSQVFSTGPYTFVWWEIRVGAPLKWPTLHRPMREAGCPPGVLCLWRNQRLWVMLCYAAEMQLMCSSFFYPSNLVGLGLWGIGGVSASPLCSRVPSVLSCTWIDILLLVGRRRKVRNDLCLRLSDIILRVVFLTHSISCCTSSRFFFKKNLYFSLL